MWNAHLYFEIHICFSFQKWFWHKTLFNQNTHLYFLKIKCVFWNAHLILYMLCCIYENSMSNVKYTFTFLNTHLFFILSIILIKIIIYLKYTFVFQNIKFVFWNTHQDIKYYIKNKFKTQMWCLLFKPNLYFKIQMCVLNNKCVFLKHTSEY